MANAFTKTVVHFIKSLDLHLLKGVCAFMVEFQVICENAYFRYS